MLVPGVAVQTVAASCSAIDPRCPMYGDVDGDGLPDRVSVKRLSACRLTLVVKTARGVVVAPLRPPCSKPSEVWPSGFPRVIALRPMNRARGFEPEVLMWRGASNSGLRFFTVRGRRLAPMRIEPESGPDDEWNVGGFADAFSLHDCLRPHVVGVWGASYTRPGWSIFGAIYEVVGTRFARTAFHSRQASRIGEPTRLWPYVHGDGFTHCGGIARERP